ncbi:protein of unknown function (plasmid) [Thermococcus nautili]|uniref:hypothetical protein n=1 Tax=Thermococcus nautili TaxID=195522 RepID=UPI002555E7D9|nr:hypothetical protein [Thermococcus nautili]CAI1494264.1 protein of unknown function [Thermococcus nautili]
MEALNDERIYLFQLRKEDADNELERLERMLNALPPTLLMEVRGLNPTIRFFRLKAYACTLDGKRIYYVYHKEKHSDGNVVTGIHRVTRFEEFVDAIVGCLIAVCNDPGILMNADKFIRTKDEELKKAVLNSLGSIALAMMDREEKEESGSLNLGVYNSELYS